MSMSRSGIVAALNPRRGMIAIEATDGGYTIIELLSPFELELGDEVTWKDDFAMGHEVYTNVTKGESEEVYVQNHGVTKANLHRQLLL
jgi:hypothetical protein